MRPVLLSVVAFAVASTLWVVQCSGPKPIVVGQPRVEAPSQPGDPYKVETTVRSEGPGHGEARVTVRLIDEGSHAAYQKDEDVQFERGETAQVVVEIPAPPANYRPSVEVEYPPE